MTITSGKQNAVLNTNKGGFAAMLSFWVIVKAYKVGSHGHV